MQAISRTKTVIDHTSKRPIIDGEEVAEILEKEGLEEGVSFSG